MKRASIALLASLLPAMLGAQSDVVPPERLASRDWFRDAKFGMFIHWGVYSQLGNGEWVMQNRGIRVPEYEWMAATFNPVRFDAEDWVATAKAAGMKYITITARHHDGFSMFASDSTRYTGEADPGRVARQMSTRYSWLPMRMRRPCIVSTRAAPSVSRLICE